jgi:Family of unknown function (DUF6350)
MTSLLSATSATAADVRHRRPLWLVAPLAGLAAALVALLTLSAATLAGWYLADAGAHGAPHDALRIGALGWLVAHGSGVHVQGASVTLVPLGLTLLCAWIVWRVAHRLGDAVSGHGPDADRIADGERDWTVPGATLLFATTYAAVAGLLVALAGDPDTAPSGGRAVFVAFLLALVVGGAAIAIGSGRLPVWVATMPEAVPATVATAFSVLRWFLVAAAVLVLVALAVDWPSAANVMSQLRTSPTGAVSMTVATLALVPNAVAFAGSYLLGAGFTVGIGTLVTPTAVVLGPLPLFPLLAALPDGGAPAPWTAYLLGVPPVAAAVGALRAQLRHPTTRWDQAALRGGVGGVLAAAAFALLASFAGGAAGPGRLQHVGAYASSSLAYAVVAFGVGGLVGGLAATFWQRRRARVSTDD